MAYLTRWLSERKTNIFHIAAQDQNEKISKILKGNRLCVNCVLTIFCSTDTLPKLKRRQGLLYLQVRLCVRWKGENTKAVLKSFSKHLSLKTRITVYTVISFKRNRMIFSLFSQITIYYWLWFPFGQFPKTL